MAISEWRDVLRRFTGRGTYPHQFAFLLLNPLRGFILSPRALVGRLYLRDDFRVLELGPGPGYFSAAVARAVPRGHLVLIDIQFEMLEKARRRLRRARVANASFAQASASALPLARATFDVAFLVTVIGEVPDPDACVGALAESLRPGGILSITELAGDPDALTREQVESLAKAHGLEFAEMFGGRGGFTMNFRKSPAPER
jgi:CAAX protease family protein